MHPIELLISAILERQNYPKCVQANVYNINSNAKYSTSILVIPVLVSSMRAITVFKVESVIPIKNPLQLKKRLLTILEIRT